MRSISQSAMMMTLAAAALAIGAPRASSNTPVLPQRVFNDGLRPRPYLTRRERRIGMRSNAPRPLSTGKQRRRAKEKARRQARARQRS